jgi:chitodextrinase
MRTRTWTRVAVGLVSAALLVAATAAPAGAATGDRTPPTVPGNLRVTGTTQTTISLAWDASRDASGLNTYIVFQSFSDIRGDFEYGIYSSPATATRTDEIGVPGFTKTYWVVAEDRAGNRSAPSNRVTASTLPDIQPPTPTTVRVTGVTQSTVGIAWTKSTDDFGTPGYKIFVNGTPWQSFAPYVGGSFATSIRHLTPGTTFSITERAVDAAGNLSAPVNTVTATTQPSNDQTPPTTPAALKITQDDGCFVKLAWTASTDNADPPSAIEYEVVVNGQVQAIITGATSSFASHSNINGSNTFAVRAADRAGNSSALSNTVTSVFQEC